MMQPGKARLWGLLVGLALLAGGGCGRGSPRPVKVEGTVTLDGQALRGATVTFLPAQESGRSASAPTDGDGKFRLTTFKTGDGALPGEYKIMVTAPTDEPPKEGGGQGLAAIKKSYAAQKSAQARKQAARRAAASPVPPIYRDARRTPLRQIVPAGGAVQIELHSSGR
jgi:hypothetical protein